MLIRSEAEKARLALLVPRRLRSVLIGLLIVHVGLAVVLIARNSDRTDAVRIAFDVCIMAWLCIIAVGLIVHGTKRTGARAGRAASVPEHGGASAKAGPSGPATQGPRADRTGQAASTNTPGAPLRELLRRIAHGDATAISVFPGLDEANARAQHKLFSAWAATSGCGLDVYSLVAVKTEPGQFLLVMIGSRDAQWALTNALRTSAFRILQSDVLTAEERAAISPVSCYENFPQPGCTLDPRGSAFERLIDELRDGAYELL